VLAGFLFECLKLAKLHNINRRVNLIFYRQTIDFSLPLW
jgi:hypothetical protein